MAAEYLHSGSSGDVDEGIVEDGPSHDSESSVIKWPESAPITVAHPELGDLVDVEAVVVAVKQLPGRSTEESPPMVGVMVGTLLAALDEYD